MLDELRQLDGSGSDTELLPSLPGHNIEITSEGFKMEKKGYLGQLSEKLYKDIQSEGKKKESEAVSALGLQREKLFVEQVARLEDWSEGAEALAVVLEQYDFSILLGRSLLEKSTPQCEEALVHLSLWVPLDQFSAITKTVFNPSCRSAAEAFQFFNRFPSLRETESASRRLDVAPFTSAQLGALLGKTFPSRDGEFFRDLLLNLVYSGWRREVQLHGEAGFDYEHLYSLVGGVMEVLVDRQYWSYINMSHYINDIFNWVMEENVDRYGPSHSAVRHEVLASLVFHVARAIGEECKPRVMDELLHVPLQPWSLADREAVLEHLARLVPPVPLWKRILYM